MNSQERFKTVNIDWSTNMKKVRVLFNCLGCLTNLFFRRRSRQSIVNFGVPRSTTIQWLGVIAPTKTSEIARQP